MLITFRFFFQELWYASQETIFQFVIYKTNTVKTSPMPQKYYKLLICQKKIAVISEYLK